MRILRSVVSLFGLVCCAVALIHIAFGPAAVPGSIPVNATLDSEDRFYATLFLGFGIALVWCAQDLANRRGAFHFLLAVFFFGGVARIISALAVGPPILLFQLLGAVELILPIILFFWLRTVNPLA